VVAQLLAGDWYTGVKPHPVWPYWFWWYAQKAWIREPCFQGSLSACNRRRKTTNESRMGKKMQINAKIMIYSNKQPGKVAYYFRIGGI